MLSGGQDQATMPDRVAGGRVGAGVPQGRASLTELARALSVEITVLRDWLDQHAPKKPRLLRTENLLDVWAPAASTNQALRTQGVLACTGNPCSSATTSPQNWPSSDTG
jgi:hypothetical protein